MSEQPTLRTGRLLLRPFTSDDVPALTRLLQDPEIAATTLTIPYPYDESMAEEWIARHRGGWERGELANFAVVLEESGELAGTVGLAVSARHRSAELGYWTGKPFWGMGVASEASRALVEWGLRELGLNRVHAHHFIRNPASGAVMRRIGMRYEGRLRQAVLKDGVFEDVDVYAILREDIDE